MNIRLPASLLPIYGTNLVDTLGYTLLIPLLPAVANKYHASPVLVAALLSTSALCATLAAPVWGILSDRLGRKQMIVAAEGLSCAGNLLLALSNSVMLFFVSRVVAGLGTGGGGALDEAFIADVTTEEQRNQAYAIYGAVYGIGFIVGPVVAGALVSRGLRIPFLIAAALAALNVVLSQRFLPAVQPRGRSSLRESIKAVSEPAVRRLVLSHFFFIYAIVCFLANFALYVQAALHPARASSASWALACAGGIGAFTLLTLVTPLTRKLGERRVALLGLACTSIAYFLLVLVHDVRSFVELLAIWAIGSAMTLPALTTLLSERAERRHLGAVMGTTDALYSLAMMLGPVTGAAIVATDVRFFGLLPGCASIAASILILTTRFRVAP